MATKKKKPVETLEQQNARRKGLLFEVAGEVSRVVREMSEEVTKKGSVKKLFSLKQVRVFPRLKEGRVEVRATRKAWDVIARAVDAIGELAAERGARIECNIRPPGEFEVPHEGPIT